MYIEDIQGKKIKRLKLDDTVMNTEAKLYSYFSNEESTHYNKILKEFYVDSGIYFSDKLYTINALIDNGEEILDYVPELILPEKIAVNGNKVVGYTMKQVNCVGLNQAFSIFSMSTEDKVSYLKKIGEILEKVKMLNEYSSIKNFSINDLHEDNFVIDVDTKELKVVDIDSCKILNNNPQIGKMLTGTSKILGCSPIKYQSMFKKCDLYYIPNCETDLYCYYMVILNFLYGKREVYKMELEEYYNYIEYLNNIGMSLEFCNSAISLTGSKKNINPFEMLENINEIYPKSIGNVYNFIKKKR